MVQSLPEVLEAGSAFRPNFGDGKALFSCAFCEGTLFNYVVTSAIQEMSSTPKGVRISVKIIKKMVDTLGLEPRTR
jgi:hypothetical protein